MDRGQFWGFAGSSGPSQSMASAMARFRTGLSTLTTFFAALAMPFSRFLFTEVWVVFIPMDAFEPLEPVLRRWFWPFTCSFDMVRIRLVQRRRSATLNRHGTLGRFQQSTNGQQR